VVGVLKFSRESVLNSNLGVIVMCSPLQNIAISANKNCVFVSLTFTWSKTELALRKYVLSRLIVPQTDQTQPTLRQLISTVPCTSLPRPCNWTYSKPTRTHESEIYLLESRVPKVSQINMCLTITF